MKSVMQEIEDMAREYGELCDLLKQCTPDEVKFFNRMYGSIEEIPKEKLSHAIFQCKNTLKKRRPNEPSRKY